MSTLIVTKRRVWRMGVGTRIFIALVGALVAGIGVATAVGSIASDPGGVQGEVGSAAMMVIGIIGAWLLAFRPRVCLDQKAVTVVNPLRTTVVPLDHVRPAATADHAGLVIYYIDAGGLNKVSAWAIQKPMLLVYLNRQAWADRVGQEIADAANQVQRGKV